MIQDSQIRAVLRELDPTTGRVDRWFDPNFFTEEYSIKFTILGFPMNLRKAVSQEMITQALMDVEMLLVNEITYDIVNAIIESYIEYWHLYYEGDMSLKEFTSMTDWDLEEYLETDGEHIGGRTYARARRLQQRDFGR